MKIVMKESAPGSVDGISTEMYEAGQEYDLTATDGERDLAAVFVGASLAEEAGAKTLRPAAAGPADGGVARVLADDDADAPAPPKPGRKPKAQ